MKFILSLKKFSIFLVFLVLGGAQVFGQSIWTNPITGTNPNTSNPYIIGQTFDPNIIVSGIGRGSGISGNGANDRYNASGWSTTALDPNDYFTFTLTPNSGFKIDFASFVYTSQASSGTPSFAIRSSLDAFTANIGTPTTTGTTINLSAATYQNITSAITFRFYGFNFTAAGTTFSINSFTFNGTVAGGVTNPIAQNLPYVQDFGSTSFSAYPVGFQGFNGMDGSAVNTQALAEASVPTGNSTVTAQTVAFLSAPTAGLYGFATSSNGRLAIATSTDATNGLNQPVVAINTTATGVITFSYDYEVLFSGSQQLGIILQYRQGTSGTWTTVSGSTINFNNPTVGAISSFSHNLTLAASSLYQFRWASWRTNGAGTNSTVALDYVAITADAPVVSQDVLMPQFMQGKTGSNTERVPFAYRVRISNLPPSRTFKYYNQAVISTDLATVDGAGNPIFPLPGAYIQTVNPSLATVNNFSTITSNGSGEATAWFVLEPTNNVRFTPGNDIFMRIMLNNGNTVNNTITHRVTSLSSAKVLTFAASAGANNGSALRGASLAADKNIIMTYDNEFGTGRPISSAYVENDGFANTVANNYAAFYDTQVNGVSQNWGAIIPNTNSNGIRRIVQLALSNAAIIGCARDADGVWPTGSIDTRNPINGLTALFISSTDAPLDICISNSNETVVSAVSSSETPTISSLINATIASNTDGVQGWQFTISEGGIDLIDPDALSTIVNKITLTQSINNQVNDWADAIQSVALFDGATLVDVGTVFTDSIVFEGLPLLSVSDGTAKTYSVRLSLQTNFNNSGSNPEGDDFCFQITAANFFTDINGSGDFAFTNVFSTNSQNVISVVATKLIYNQQPSNVGQFAAISPSVRIYATDVNNNLDLDFTSSVSITSTGALAGSPVSVSAIAGIATFSTLIHNVVQSNVLLTATSGSFTIVSNPFNVNLVTIIQKGDLSIVAYNSNISSSDEFTIATFVDILPGTKIDFTDNAYEKCIEFSEGWALNEGWIRVERTTSTLLAGSTFTVRVTNAGSVASVISPDANWITSPNPQPAGQGLFSLSDAGEQLYILQGGTVGGPGATTGTSDAGTYAGGRIIAVFNTFGNSWTATCASSSPGTQQSRKPRNMDCFIIYPPSISSRCKFVGDGTPTYLTVSRTKAEWLNAIALPANWATYADNTLYNTNLNHDYVNAGAGKSILISAGGFVDGKWTGTIDADWNKCKNWENLDVPGLTDQVNFQSGTPFSAVLSGTSRGLAQNISIANGATLTVTTTDSLVLSGSMTNNGTFTQTGTGFVVFRGVGVAAITGTTATTTFSRLTIDKGLGGLLQFDRNVTTTDTLFLKSGTFNLTSTNTLNMAELRQTAGFLATNPLGNIRIVGTGSFGNFRLSQASPGTSNAIKNFAYARLGTSLLNLTDLMEVHGELNLSSTLASFTTNGNLTLKSNDTTTASIANLITPANFNGIIKAERYNNGAIRRYRHMGSPVTLTDANQLIDNVFVTGNGGVSNGFDASPRNNPTVFTYQEPIPDNSSNLIAQQLGFVGLPTAATNIPVGAGFLVFTRGPRLTQPSPFSSASIPLPAVVDFNGLINKGTIPVTVTKTIHPNTILNEQFEQIDGFNFLGNPYPSAIDAGLFALSSPSVEKFIYSYNIGTGTYDVHDINTPAASSPLTAPRIVGLGQGFFVKSTAASVVVNFTESMKVNTQVPLVYTRSAQQAVAAPNAFNIFRLKIVADSVNSDETVLIFGGTDTKTYQQGRDALKYFGSGVSLAMVTNDYLFTAIKYLPTVTTADTISLYVKKIPRAAISVDNATIASFNPNLNVYLLDNYLNITTDLRTNSSYNFITNTDSASFGAGRFKLIFDTNGPLSSDLLSFTGKAEGNNNRLNWSANEAIVTNGYYEIEKSINGKDFEKFDQIDFSASTALVNYSAIDINPTEAITYYRLKIVSVKASSIYSKTIAIERKTKNSNVFSIYPNPVSSFTTIRLYEESKTDKILLVKDAAGKTIQKINLKAGQKEITIDFSTLASGSYFLSFDKQQKNEGLKFIKE